MMIVGHVVPLLNDYSVALDKVVHAITIDNRVTLEDGVPHMVYLDTLGVMLLGYDYRHLNPLGDGLGAPAAVQEE